MSVAEFTIYDPATGEIAYSVSLPDGQEPELAMLGGLAFINGHYDGEHYFVDPATHQATERTPFPVSLSAGLVTGVPPGTLAVVAHEPVAVDDGEIAIEGSLGLPQDVPVVLIHPQHIREELIVSCPV